MRTIPATSRSCSVVKFMALPPSPCASVPVSVHSSYPRSTSANQARGSDSPPRLPSVGPFRYAFEGCPGGLNSTVNPASPAASVSLAKLKAKSVLLTPTYALTESNCPTIVCLPTLVQLPQFQFLEP